MKKKIAIIGAGIAGLTLANFIKKNSASIAYVEPVTNFINRYGKTAVAPSAIISTLNIDWPFMITPNFNISGIIIKNAGTSLSTSTSSTVRFPLTANLVPIRKAAQIVTVASAARTPRT